MYASFFLLFLLLLLLVLLYIHITILQLYRGGVCIIYYIIFNLPGQLKQRIPLAAAFVYVIIIILSSFARELIRTRKFSGRNAG